MKESEDGRRIHLSEGYSVSRLIVGGWQFSQGHGAGAAKEARELLAGLVEMGLTTYDCADIYTGVEELFGWLVRERRSAHGDPGIQIHTKFVPDLDALGSMNKSYVERIIHRSLRRLAVERLDLVQFHWWDYSVPRYVEVAGWLADLRDKGKIRHLGVTNFDRAHLEELVYAGVEVVSNQIQYSVLDRRPERDLASYCREKGIALLCYGGLAGGFLTDTYLGMDQPPAQDANRSLTKYRLMIDEMGGWESYQGILKALAGVARRRGTSLPSVALRFVLDQPTVASTITGLDSIGQANQTMGVLSLRLESEDLEEIEGALANSKVPPGPVYGLERDRQGPHGRIMRYNLNRG